MNIFKTTEIKLLGAFFLITGIYGIITFLGLLLPFSSIFNLLNLFPTILFGLTLYSGYLILLKEDEKGIEIGRAVVALQLIEFQVAGVGYVFITGGYIFFGMKNFSISMDFGLDNTFIIGLSGNSADFVFAINILALAVFIYLTKILKKIDRIKDREQMDLMKEEHSGKGLE